MRKNEIKEVWQIQHHKRNRRRILWKVKNYILNYKRVYLAEANQTQFAIKIIDKTKIVEEKLRDCIKTEIQTMRVLRHPYVVKLYEVMISSRGIILVMEYVKGGDFFEKISKLRSYFFLKQRE